MPNPIRYIAIDDNPVDLLILQEYARGYEDLQSLGQYGNIDAGLAAINQQQPDLVFLDIELPGGDGLEILRTVRKQVPMAVFITSHPEFALDGFELSALDFILKPLTADRFEMCIAKITDYWQLLQKASSYEFLAEQDVLLIKEGHARVKLPVGEIIYLEALTNYTKIVTSEKKYITLNNLKNFLDELPKNKFLRIHRSYAVAIDKVKGFSGNDLHIAGQSLPLGKTYRQEVKKFIKDI